MSQKNFHPTKYQWEYAGDSYTPVTEYDPADLYNVHSPNWNETGSQNAAGVVAVIDCGVDYEHPDLKDVMYVFPSELQEKLQCGPYGINTAETGDKKNPMDYESHGTHCAGVIATPNGDFSASRSRPLAKPFMTVMPIPACSQAA